MKLDSTGTLDPKLQGSCKHEHLANLGLLSRAGHQVPLCAYPLEFLENHSACEGKSHAIV